MEVKKYRIDGIAVWFTRRYRDPDATARFNASVKELGQQVPAVLAEIEGTTVLADGHARLEALKADGKTEILAWVDPRLDSKEKLLGLLVESEERSDRNVVDLGMHLKAYQQQHGLNQKQLALALKLSEAKVSRILSIFEFDERVVHLVGLGRLTPKHLSAVSKVCDKTRLLLKAADEGWTTAKLRASASSPKPKRSRVMKLSAKGLTALVPASMSVQTFDEAIAQIREQVAAAEKVASKKALTVSQVLSDL